MHADEPRRRQFGFDTRAREADGVIAGRCRFFFLWRAEIIHAQLADQRRREKVSVLTRAAGAADVCLAEAENVFVGIVARRRWVHCVRANVYKAKWNLCSRRDVASILRANERIGISDQGLGASRRLKKCGHSLGEQKRDCEYCADRHL